MTEPAIVGTRRSPPRVSAGLSRPAPPGTDGIYEIGGIYLDNGSNLITVRDNVILNVEGAIIKTNGNGPSNTVTNNDGLSASTMGDAGLEPEYQDIRPTSP